MSTLKPTFLHCKYALYNLLRSSLISTILFSTLAKVSAAPLSLSLGWAFLQMDLALSSFDSTKSNINGQWFNQPRRCSFAKAYQLPSPLLTHPYIFQCQCCSFFSEPECANCKGLFVLQILLSLSLLFWTSSPLPYLLHHCHHYHYCPC